MFSAMISTILTVIIALVPWQVLAQPATGNGCGTGWSAYLVPDSIPLAGCNFRNACEIHDVCYGACERPQVLESDQTCIYRKCRFNGELYGQSICEQDPYLSSEIAARVRRTSCDKRFYLDLRELNQGRLICVAFAALYAKAVEAFGLNAFIGVAPPSAKEGELPFTSGSREAIESFFNQANEAQLRELIERIEQPGQLDPAKPLMYIPGAGLRNDVTP